MKEQYLAQRGEHEVHLNKQDKIYLKQSADHVPRVALVGAKVPLTEMRRSHWMNLRGQDSDIWELLDYRFGSYEKSKRYYTLDEDQKEK